MSLFSDLRAGFRFARQLRTEQRSTLSNPSAELLAALNGGPTKSGSSVNENTAFNVSAVRACVDVRANLVAMLPIKVYQKTGTGPQEQRDHALARLFRGRVSPGQTRFKFIHSAQVCFDIGGNAYARIFRNTYAEPAVIRYLKACDVTPLENKRTGATGFRLAGVGDLPQHEVLHVANLSTNGVTGRSPIQDLREAVGLALTAEEFTARSFANGNRKPGILQGKEGMTPARAREFLDFWMQHYAGVANAGKTPLLWGTEWKDAGFSNDEAELLGQRKFSIEEIARVYHLPLHLIGSTDKATTWGSGIEQLNQGLVDYTLAPICKNWEEEINTTLLTEREQEEGFYVKFCVDALLRGSPQTRAAFYEKMRAIRAMTSNEIRGLEELTEAPDAGANKLDWPMNNQGGGGQPVADPVAADPATQA